MTDDTPAWAIALQARLLSGIEGLESKVDARLDKVDARLDKVDARLDKVDARLDRLEAEVNRQRADFGLGFERLNDRMTSFEGALTVTLGADSHLRRQLALRAEDHGYLLEQIGALQQQIVRLEGRLAVVERKAA